MKPIFLLQVAALAVCLHSCNFLEYDHYDGPVTEEQYWELNNSARGQLNRGYTFLLEGYNRYGGAMLAAGCDEAINSDLNSSVNTFNNGTWSPLRVIDDAYAHNYNGIRQVNVFLENAHRANIVPVTDIPRLRGEAFFLRAFFHFELLKRYGGVIYLDHVLGTNDDLDLPRNTFEETVAFIIADCDSAAALLPLGPGNYGSGDRGRATKAASMALKSRTLLYAASPLNNPSNSLSLWENAANASKELIETKAHGLLANFANIFNFSVAAYNTEVIFATAASNRNDIEINNAPISFDGALGRTNPTQELVDAYQMSNGLDIDDPDSGYDPSDPYTDRDPRFYATIFYNGSVFKNDTVKTLTGGKDGIGQTINATKSGYYMKKFLSASATWNQTSNASVRRPWVLFRYAEVLLNYAEAQNEAAGPDDSVYDAVNQIRKRAGMPALSPGLTQSEMRLTIQQERQVELAFEEHRFWDIRRWKIAEQVLNKPVTGMNIKVENGELVYDRFLIETRMFTPAMYRYPIPQNEIYNTLKLQQNEGY